MNEAEMKFFNLQRIEQNERLACQVEIQGDLIVRVADENKLPHIQYSD
jgi:2Fe-2S ferredoxin